MADTTQFLLDRIIKNSAAVTADAKTLKVQLAVAPTPIPTPVPVVTTHGITDRIVRPKPAPMALGPAGSSWIEPTFGKKMWRVTDPNTNGGSGVFPASIIGGAWSRDGAKFVLMGSGGNAMFWAFDDAKVTPLPVTIRQQSEPWFSYVDPNVIYGNALSPEGDYRLIRKWNLATGVSADVVDLDLLYPHEVMATGGYIGPLAVVDNDVWAVLFGGYAQNSHPLVHHSVYGLIDYRTLTVQSNAGPVPGTTLHGIGLDRLGRLMLNPSDAGSATGIAQIQVYNPATRTLTPLTNDLKGNGHYQVGYGQMVNMEDPYQWLLRSLDNLTSFTGLITVPLTPAARGLDDHSDWRNAQPGKQLPILSVTIRKDLPLLSGGPWGPWDDEVLLVHTDKSGIVERFAHHQSVYDPDNYRSQPEGHLNPAGTHTLFSSNWGQGLGTYIDHNDNDKVKYRTDVFLVALT